MAVIMIPEATTRAIWATILQNLLAPQYMKDLSLLMIQRAGMF